MLQIRAARKNQTGTRHQQTKRWKTDESAKKIGHAGIEKYRSSFDDTDSGSAEGLLLREDQAVGQVVAAQANFMRIFIERTWNNEHMAGSPEFQKPNQNPREEGVEQLSTSLNAWEVSSGVKAGTELLCVVRALLKKIKRRVLVGDRVLVSGIDWTDRRGMVEDVLDRRSEIAEPPVANVEHLLVIFALDRPKLEPIALSRFLVEAESTEIPFTLILNKADLVQQQVHHHQFLKHLRSPNVGSNFEFKSFSPEGLTIMLADALSYMPRAVGQQPCILQKLHFHAIVGKYCECGVIFALDRCKLEPLALRRFLVEAGPAGISFTLILNKADFCCNNRYFINNYLNIVNLHSGSEFPSCWFKLGIILSAVVSCILRPAGEGLQKIII